MEERDEERMPESEESRQPKNEEEKRLEDLAPSDEEAADLKAGARMRPNP